MFAPFFWLRAMAGYNCQANTYFALNDFCAEIAGSAGSRSTPFTAASSHSNFH